MQVRALGAVRQLDPDDELDKARVADLIYLILCTVSGIAAGLQNTG